MIIFLFVSCDNTPLKSGSGEAGIRITYFTAIPSANSAVITWGCSSESSGFLVYGLKGPETFLSLGNKAKTHVITISGLTQQTTYQYYVTCGEFGGKGTSIPLTFRTTGINDDLQKRSIWILGGTSNGNTPLAQVDMYDPVDNIWYTNITSIPTPRLFAGVVSNNGKIYVMGGLKSVSGIFTTVNTVEEYTPATNTWKTMATMPTTLQGFVVSSVGQDIYAIGGTTTTDMTTGTLFNTVYKFTPSLGTTGTWVTKTSFSTITAKIDMAGCVIDGTIFFSTGRLFSDGSPQSTNDGYVVSANSTTSITEAGFTARHGAGAACYRPLSTDSYPTDTPAMIVVGGSTLADFNQPVTSTASSSLYEYYTAGTVNTVSTGPILPAVRYFPALEISYQKRAVYVFGGGSLVNVATNTVYSLDLTNPTGGPWSVVNTTMPVSRFGHKAVILSR
ncbi:MAG: hypothetical protein K8R21_13590 [Leptospira sp.]|nr:hypothetical protein [Leptospira sp.]